MAAAVALYPLAKSKIATGGEAVTAMNGPVAGGLIANPPDATEPLFVDVTGSPAALAETATTFELQPGQTFQVPANQATDVSVNASTAGHRFSGVVFQPPTQFPPTPQTGTFPPPGPTTATRTIPAYLYQQYSDDDDLQAFVSSANALAQSYVDWFVNTPLGAYTDAAIAGALLDWVARGIYGFERPSLSSGQNQDEGAINTFVINTLAINEHKVVGPSDVTVTSDDIFRRIITWNFYKGDGIEFNVRWVKRRVMRFLLGTDGSAPNIDQTYPVSVTVGDGILNIQITTGTRTLLEGDINSYVINSLAINEALTLFTPAPNHLAFENVLQEAIESGVLQFPFQVQVTIQT